MTEHSQGGRRQVFMRALVELGLPALAFALGVGLATGNWPTSFATGLVISSAIAGLYWLDQRFVHPRLEKLSRDWLHLGLEMTFLLLDHVVGAVVALLVCSRIFGFEVIPGAAWLGVVAMVIAFPVIHGTEMALRFFRQVQEKERQEEQLKALATEAELKALKAQINPHFLFNTLNTIAELIHADSERAEATVERLAEMFRYVLNGTERGLVPLEEELAFLDDYLEIERVRFGDRLRFTRAITPAALDVRVPSLLLQPLVENAVRHGQGADGSIDLRVAISTDGDLAVIAISDQGPGLPPRYAIGEGAAHGLYNVDQRLRKTYGQAYGLEIGANQPMGTIVTLRIPMGRGMRNQHNSPLDRGILGLLVALVATNITFLILWRTGGPLIGLMFYLVLLARTFRARQRDYGAAMVGGLVGLAVHVAEVATQGWSAYPVLMTLNLVLPATLAFSAWRARQMTTASG